MGSQWFYKTNEEEAGPVPFGELAKLVRTGVISEDVPVRRQGTNVWTRACDVIGLFRAARLGASAPPPEAIPVPAKVDADAALRAAIEEAAWNAGSTDAEATPLRERFSGQGIAIAACGLLLIVAAFAGWQVTQPVAPRFQRMPPVAPLSFFGFGPLSPLEYALCWLDLAAVVAGAVWWTAHRFRGRAARASP